MDFLPVKKLGFGYMRLPQLSEDDVTAIDYETLNKMVDSFMDQGFTYFDTAYVYHNGVSEVALRKSLVERYPRESFTIATKFPGYIMKDDMDPDTIFNEELSRLGTDYIDYYLLHSIQRSNYESKYEKYNLFTWLQEKKAAGQVKYAGFSYHSDAEYLDKILTEHPEVDFVQLQINYLDWETDTIQSKACHDVCAKHGKKVIVMEPIKGGTLVNVPEKAEKIFKEAKPELSVPSWAIRFAASQPQVMMVLSGMTTEAAMADNTSYMKDFETMTEAELKLCADAAAIINEDIAIPCTGCAYCVKGCPMNIAIPKYFKIYNADYQERNTDKAWTAQGSYYSNEKDKGGAPLDCIECGQCEEVCPQHLEIRKFLKEVAEHFEG